MNKNTLLTAGLVSALFFVGCDLFGAAKADTNTEEKIQDLKVEVPDSLNIDDVEKAKIAELSEKCQGEYIGLQGDNGGPDATFINDCMGEVKDAWMPEGLSAECETLYANAFEPTKLFAETDCSVEVNRTKCEEINKKLEIGSEAFFTKCEAQLPKDEDVFPWQGGDDKGDYCEGPDCGGMTDMPMCKPEKVMTECPDFTTQGQDDAGVIQCCKEGGECFTPYDFSDCQEMKDDYCLNNPGDEGCKMMELCKQNPSAPECKMQGPTQEERDYCNLNPTEEKCKILNLCMENPNAPECVPPSSSTMEITAP